MNKSRRSRWSSIFSRTGAEPAGNAAQRVARPSRLARLMGAAGEEHGFGAVELLEPRQMLTVGPITIAMGDDLIPGTNLHYRIVQFSYYLPWLTATRPEEPEPPADMEPPTPRYAEFVDAQIFGGTILFIGPVGAQFNIKDLAGNDFHFDELATRIPTGTGVPEGVLPGIDDGLPAGPGAGTPDDGIPDFNYGIGSITFENTNANTVFVITGALQINAPDYNGGTPLADVEVLGTRSQYAEFESKGFGFTVSSPAVGEEPRASGLPNTAPGTIMVGGPFVRDTSTEDDFWDLEADIDIDFNNEDHGIFIDDGSSIGRIYIDGMLFGDSVFSGAVGELSVGLLLGSVTVEGDVGTISSAQDAGVWFDDSDIAALTNTNPVQSTGASITIGRTVRAIDVGGRNGLRIEVLGQINNPDRAILPFREFTSREKILGVVETTDGIEFINAVLTNPFGTGQGLFGSGMYRNDSIGSAEYVGHSGTSVVVSGTLGGRDNINTGADNTDVYAFAADPTREIIISGLTAIGTGYARIVDKDGRVVAAQTTSRAGRGIGFDSLGNTLRFRPQRADVYYLVMSSNFQTDAIGTSYNVTITGMAPTSVGQVRTGLAVGRDDTGQPPLFDLNVSNGSLGSFRVGTSFVTPAGTDETSFQTIINTNQTDPQRLIGWGTSSLNIGGTIFGIWAGGNAGTGSDTDGGLPRPTVSTGGNLGTLATGQLAFGGTGVQNGDVESIHLLIGGSIGLLDIHGALGAHAIQGMGDRIRTGPDVVVIKTGQKPNQRGDIGQILIGNYMSGAATQITTKPGSQIDQMIVGAGDIASGDGEWFGFIKFGQAKITMGAGSDFRFLEYVVLENQGSLNQAVTIFYGQTIRLVDDAGAEFTITLSGGVPGLAGGSSAVIRYLPIDLSQGVALGRIDATLAGGANLVITGVTQGVVSVGRISVDATFGDTTATGPASQVLITGPTEIDVAKIDVIAGRLEVIRNQTHGGDIVAIDAVALGSIFLPFGNLGRTQTTGIGVSLLGPFLGIAPSASANVGGPLTVLAAANQPWNGQLYTPVRGGNFGVPGSLEDIGSPIDPYLNGVVVRTGDLNNVQVAGSVGDVIVQAGNLINLTANTDALTPQGGFDGIVGSIYANNIGTVDVGDGLRGTGPTGLAQAGIFANAAIGSVLGTRIANVKIQGVIIATGIGATVPRNIGLVSIGNTKGRAEYDRALIASVDLDEFWASASSLDNSSSAGRVGRILGVNADMFGSRITGTLIDLIELKGGAFDATQVSSSTSITSVRAAEFRNSTLLDTSGEQLISSIVAANSVGTVETIGMTGDMADLVIDVGGSITGRVAARNITRTTFQINNLINLIQSTQDIRAISVTAGRVVNVTVGRDLRSSSFDVAGPISKVTVKGEITNMVFNSTGPDASIGTITAGGMLTGQLFSAGPMGTIESKTSDIIADINTRNDLLRNNNGGVKLIKAARDIIGNIRMFGDTGMIIAGRHIGANDGTQRLLDLRGNVGTIQAGGQLYEQLVVGQSVTKTITVGRVPMLPGNDQVAETDILVFGRIAAINVTGDLNSNVTSKSGGIGIVNITSGSFRQGKTIEANNGSIDGVNIRGGHLLGDVLADLNIKAITLSKGSDGFVGHIGIADGLTDMTPFDAFRNALPPGTAQTAFSDGPLIKAGVDIGTIKVAGPGGAWETRIIAGRNISTIQIDGGFKTDALSGGTLNAIVAGNSIGKVTIGGSTKGLNILAGAKSLGDDMAVGGTLDDADVVGPGSVGPVVIGGSADLTYVLAGIQPNAGGDYLAGDATRALGTSSIASVKVTGAVGDVRALSAGTIGTTTAGIATGGSSLDVVTPTLIQDSAIGAELALTSGVAFVFSIGAETGTFLFKGPGSAFWDEANTLLRLSGTTSASSLVVTATGLGTLSFLKIKANSEAAIGTLTVTGTLLGDSTIFVNQGIKTLTLGTVDISGTIGSGGNIDTIKVGSFLFADLVGKDVKTMTVTGDFGRGALVNDATAVFRSLTTLSISGALAGVISSSTAINAATLGSVAAGGLRSGDAINKLTIKGTVVNGIVSARNKLGPVVINGEVRDSDLLAGLDLGTDAAYGGIGDSADTLGNGSITSVTVGGNFIRSNIAAGVAKGPSGFYGGTDQQVASGRSFIGPVIIKGSTIGSAANSQQYRIVSTGTVGKVTVANVPTTARGNFKVIGLGATAAPLLVTGINVSVESGIYTAVINFNQAIDESTLSPSLSIGELRYTGGPPTYLALVEGPDFTVVYNAELNQARITFSPEVTERTVADAGLGDAAAGVYQFTLSAMTLRGSSTGSMLDGDGNGVAGDDFVGTAIVGDAGDRTTPMAFGDIDLFGAADLDQVLRSSGFTGTLPQTNKTFTIDGAIGDHPDINTTNFRAGSDLDVYRVSLKAGQILRLGAPQGIASGAAIRFYDSSGVAGVVGDSWTQLATEVSESGVQTQSFLVKETGTYFIAVGTPAGTNPPDDIGPGTPPSNLAPAPGAFGTYSMDVQVFDDGNTGFHGGAGENAAVALVEPPLATDFVGSTPITIGDWTFTIKPAVAGVNTSPGTIITGTNSNPNSQGWTSVRTVAALGGVDKVVITAPTAIDQPNQSGTPNRVLPDVDVYSLNNGDTIDAGTRYRVTLKVNLQGSNLGVLPPFFNRNTGAVISTTNLLGQSLFGLFEYSGTGIDDARLVAAPSEYVPIGQPTKTITDGRSTYGYDANGDFYMEFEVPPSLDDPMADAPFALFVQGTIRSNYTLEVQNLGAGAPTEAQSQNVLLETLGGLVDWLDPRPGHTTELGAFSSGILGFQGIVEGTTLTADQYIIEAVRQNLQDIFDAAGVQVNIATSSADFTDLSSPDYSTVYLSNAQPPELTGLAPSEFGVSQHVDAFNADRNDEAVVFASDFAAFGFDSSKASADAFAAGLTAAVGRRIGELLGLRLMESDLTFGSTSIMRTSSVQYYVNNGVPAPSGAFVSGDIPLAGVYDGSASTVFYLGQQSSLNLLQQVVKRV